MAGNSNSNLFQFSVAVAAAEVVQKEAAEPIAVELGGGAEQQQSAEEEVEVAGEVIEAQEKAALSELREQSGGRLHLRHQCHHSSPTVR